MRQFVSGAQSREKLVMVESMPAQELIICSESSSAGCRLETWSGEPYNLPGVAHSPDAVPYLREQAGCRRPQANGALRVASPLVKRQQSPLVTRPQRDQQSPLDTRPQRDQHVQHCGIGPCVSASTPSHPSSRLGRATSPVGNHRSSCSLTLAPYDPTTAGGASPLGRLASSPLGRMASPLGRHTNCGVRASQAASPPRFFVGSPESSGLCGSRTFLSASRTASPLQRIAGSPRIGSATAYPGVPGSGTKVVPPDMERFAPSLSPTAAATRSLEHRVNQAAASPTRSVVAPTQLAQGNVAVNWPKRGGSVITRTQEQALRDLVEWGVLDEGSADFLMKDRLGYQDPWDGCEDLASEGLAEWHQDFQRLNASSIQDAAFLVQDPAASCSSVSSRQEKSNVFQRDSMSTLSTSASLETSTSRSIVGLPPPKSRSSAFTPKTSLSTGLSEIEVNEPGEDSDGNDAWELEFMMRAKMDAAEAGTLCNK